MGKPEILFKLKVLQAQTHLVNHLANNLKTGSETFGDWYAGISGQKDKDDDGKSDRIVGHRRTFTKLDESSWEEYHIYERDTTKREEIAIETETNLRNLGFDTGKKIQAGESSCEYCIYFQKRTY